MLTNKNHQGWTVVLVLKDLAKCLRLYVCMYACMYVRVYVCMYVCMYVSVYLFVLWITVLTEPFNAHGFYFAII